MEIGDRLSSREVEMTKLFCNLRVNHIVASLPNRHRPGGNELLDAVFVALIVKLRPLATLRLSGENSLLNAPVCQLLLEHAEQQLIWLLLFLRRGDGHAVAGIAQSGQPDNIQVLDSDVFPSADSLFDLFEHKLRVVVRHIYF